jgi:tetratricopeptide (TPR) repeat protein
MNEANRADRSPNTLLKAVLEAGGVTYEALARSVRAVAAEAGEALRTNRSAVAHWVAGSRPGDATARYLSEALSRHLGRAVSLEEIGLAPLSPADEALDWRADTLAALNELGRLDLDMERRRALSTAAYSVAALSLPEAGWWGWMAERSRSGAGRRHVGRRDLEAIRDVVSLFARIDNRHGGGHARTAIVQYLTRDIAPYLNGRFADDRVRRDLFSTASELAYLAGWTAFDTGEHPVAQRYFASALKLAAEADDPPMTGHVLRGMAYQALYLGHGRQSLDLARAAMEGKRYGLASPRERMMFGAQLGRSLAATGQPRAAGAALTRAEHDFTGAPSADDQQDRLFGYFGEADLAYQTGHAMRDSGDLPGALRQFRHSVRIRNATTYARIYARTLGDIGAVQARQGNIEEACTTWSRALDAMDGIHSARARNTVANMRRALTPVRGRGIRAVTDLDNRAATYLAESA